MEQVRLPFPDQVKRLNHHSFDICTMEIGHDLLRATCQRFGYASFSELAMFPFFMKKLMKYLTDFHVPDAGLFKGKMEEIIQWVRYVLEIDDLVSIEKNLSIIPLLRLILTSLPMLDLVEAFLDKLRTDLLL
ncbi:hypothetical protein AMTRI_Chr11g153050 [Amborella trichopoda]